MHARVSFYQLDEGGDIDLAVKSFDEAIPTVEQMEGNQGLQLLIDRDSGKAITITLWDSPESLSSTTQQADSVREQAAGTGGLTIQTVEAYEVVRDQR
jgi:heme-degrading monooxygenase HmoA